MRQYRELLQLSGEQKSELSRWAQSRTLAAGDVFRARLILALAEGWSYSQIKERLQTTAPTISRWKQTADGIPARSSLPFWKGWWRARRGPSRSM